MNDFLKKDSFDEYEWDVFISYAHEDKRFVQLIVESLKNTGIKVWYDDDALKLGDSLLNSIDHGLSKSKFGIVVLSSSYFKNKWTKNEIAGLIGKERKGVEVILPIWHKIERDEVLKYSPILADRVAAKSSEGIDQVVKKLLNVIVSSSKQGKTIRIGGWDGQADYYDVWTTQNFSANTKRNVTIYVYIFDSMNNEIDRGEGIIFEIRPKETGYIRVYLENKKGALCDHSEIKIAYQYEEQKKYIDSRKTGIGENNDESNEKSTILKVRKENPYEPSNTDIEYTIIDNPIDAIGFQEIAKPKKVTPRMNFVFLHGLGGKSITTWMADRNNLETFWPLWLINEKKLKHFPLQIGSIGYETSVGNWKSNTMPLYDLGESILEMLIANDFADNPLIFMTHSMGGIAIKQILDTAHSVNNKKWKNILKKTKAIVFISTPHRGTKIANFLNYVARVLNIKEKVPEIESHGSRLKNLNDHFLSLQKKHKICTKSFYETKPLSIAFTLTGKKVKFKTPILIVDKEAADPGIVDNQAVPVIADHANSCKPKDRKDEFYKNVRSFLADCCKSNFEKK